MEALAILKSMRARFQLGSWLFMLVSFGSTLYGQSSSKVDTRALLAKIDRELAGPITEDGQQKPNVPHGEIVHGILSNSSIYPGTANEFQVYVPVQYRPETPACLLIKLDGLGEYEATVLDNLIAQQALPVIIGVGITPGTIWKDPPGTPGRRAFRFDRSYEFDSMNDHFPDFVLNELLPAVKQMKTQDGRPIRISDDANAHAVTGGSTGGIGSFTLAWRRPDQFTRVYSVIGTFVSMRGGNEYPVLIRKTDPKPIRIFLEDGSTDAWNPLFGSWFDANLNMESALRFAGYDVAHAWGKHGHTGDPGKAIFPDVMRWLWRDYPNPIRSGASSNSTLQEVTIPGETWRVLPPSFTSAGGLAAKPSGAVYWSDAPARAVYTRQPDGTVQTAATDVGAAGLAFGPDGTLYAAVPENKQVVQLNAGGAATVIARNITASSILVDHANALFVTEPGEHDDEPSRIWRVRSYEAPVLLDQGLRSASGIAFTPDGSLFYAAEHTTRWVYSYVVQPDGSFADKQRFDWLHISDVVPDSGAETLAIDTHGNLYVASRMGVQICDQNGRVRAILPLPAPSGPVRSICFGGPNFTELYATDGKHIFVREMKVPGFAPWAAPRDFASQGAG